MEIKQRRGLCNVDHGFSNWPSRDSLLKGGHFLLIPVLQQAHPYCSDCISGLGTGFISIDYYRQWVACVRVPLRV